MSSKSPKELSECLQIPTYLLGKVEKPIRLEFLKISFLHGLHPSQQTLLYAQYHLLVQTLQLNGMIPIGNVTMLIIEKPYWPKSSIGKILNARHVRRILV